MMWALVLMLMLVGDTGGQNLKGVSVEQAIRSDEPKIKEELDDIKQSPQEVRSEEKGLEKTLEEKIGQLFLPTIHRVHGVLSAERNFLEKYKPCGVVLKSLLEPKTAVDLVSFVRLVSASADTPIWIAGDLYELTKRPRGAPSQYVDLPPLLCLSANPDDEMVARLMKLWKMYLYGLGLNLCLGPRLSLASELTGMTDDLHCLGSNPTLAGEVSVKMLSAWDEQDVLLVPMDFPGGATNRDGVKPAVLLTPESLLMENDLVPYVKFIHAGHSILHIGTTLVPTLDPVGMPACISESVIARLVREKLGYTGVVIAGPLDSPEVVKHIDPSDAGLRALKLGADILYYGGEVNTVMRAIDRVKFAVANGELSLDRIEESYARVKELKSKQFETPQVEEKEKLKVKPDELVKQKGDIYEDAYFIIKNSITLVRNSGDLLPLEKGSVAGIGITGAVGVNELEELLRKYHKNISVQPMRSSFRLGYIEKFEIERAEKTVGKAPVIICVVVSSMRLAEQEELVNRLKDTGSKVIVVVLGHPSALATARKADAVLIAYAEQTAYSLAIRAVAETIVGLPSFRFKSIATDSSLVAGKEYKFSLGEVVAMPPGRLPISVGDCFPEGSSLSLPVEKLIRKCQWKIGEKIKFDTPDFTYAFPSPGEYKLELKVQGPDKFERVKTFSLVVK
ncbi:MAG: hypothetical protein N3G21_12410 [Candidatus Hydrogenedentes bacterium]|nr:hypothetical protein [Candidatus Hydrogenedentota bacterium]